MTQSEPSCKMCGKCCSYEIPVTLLDLHRIGKHLSIQPDVAFESYVQRTVSERSGLFMISKREDRACVFLGEDNRCTIHGVKPRACRFYFCGNEATSEGMPWTVTCTSDEARAELWEQSVAAMVTRAYIKDNGSTWNEAAYYKAILSIYDNIITSDTQRIKMARDPNGEPVCIIYDCSTCDKQGACASETPVTLDDIRRITQHAGLSWKAFFQSKLDPEPSVNTGTFRLARSGHCVFFDPETHCTIARMRPMHCRFTPCPQKAQADDVFSCLYLGAGTVEDQFRHQVALTVTRAYVQEYGVAYNNNGVRDALQRIDRLVGDRSALDQFCQRLAPFRYVDDTLLVKQR